MAGSSDKVNTAGFRRYHDEPEERQYEEECIIEF